MNLRELTSDQQAILAQVEDGDFTLDDVSDHLELLEGERNKKIENYLHVINRLEGKALEVNAEILRLEAIRGARTKALANIKAWLLMSMQDGEKHEFDLFKVSRVKGREVVSITNDKLIPNEFFTIKSVRNLDKREILKELKTGVEINGAEITTGNPSLRIK